MTARKQRRMAACDPGKRERLQTDIQLKKRRTRLLCAERNKETRSNTLTGSTQRGNHHKTRRGRRRKKAEECCVRSTWNHRLTHTHTHTRREREKHICIMHMQNEGRGNAHLRWQCAVRDLVERDDGHAAPKPTLLQQLKTDMTRDAHELMRDTHKCEFESSRENSGRVSKRRESET